MACSVLKYLIFVAFLSQWQNAQGTRFQPSIIWDIYNKLISCKCNWMNIAKLDNYDRIELLCPSDDLVSSTRDHDVAKTRQYYNIFMRKFNMKNHTMDELRESLYNGSFCDPSVNETKMLYTCEKKKGESSVKLRFHEQEDLHVGDIAVFFCNKRTGLQSDLRSRDKRCEMVFIANVTAHERKKYDSSYGKCLLPLSDSNCDNIYQNCPCENSSTPQPPEPGTTTPTMTTQEPTKKTDETRRPAAKDTRTSSESSQIYLLFVGLIVGIVVTALFFLILLNYCKNKGKLQFAKNTVEKHELSYNDIGISNKVYSQTKPTAPLAELLDECDNVMQNKPQPSNGISCGVNGKLPPIETNECPLEPATKETNPSNAAL